MKKYSISIEKVSESRLKDIDLNNIVFGKELSDHMLVADYYEEDWHNVRIIPFQNLSLSPATSALHYGQSIFEGLKAYKTKNDKPVVFRPRDNWKRMNRSAIRMCMPEIPEEIFMEGLKKLIEIDQKWIPQPVGSSLYVRPFMFSTDAYVGIKPSDTYKFIIFSSPAGPYYTEPIKVYIEEKYTRAAKGGVGAAKAAGNYGGSLYPAKIAQQKGFRQLIWTDAKEHKYIEEAGTMNVFFVINGVIYTPALKNGTILEGITRDSILHLLKDEGYKVKETDITVDDILEAHKKGDLNEAFGAGTAATIASIKAIGYRDRLLELPPQTQCHVSQFLFEKLSNIKRRIDEDKYNWVEEI